MSHWRDNIQQASFRGKLFNVDTATFEFGRRVSLHELPFKDNPYAEDLGRKGRLFSFAAFVDELTVPAQGYFQTLDELIDAIENDDSIGTLVVPTKGKHQVRPTACSSTWSRNVGGMETVTLTFVEAGELIFPLVTINTKETTFIQKAATDTAIEEEAGEAIDFTPTQSDSSERIIDPDVMVDESVQIPNKFIEAIESALEKGQQANEAVQEFARTLEDYKNDIKTKMFEPFSFLVDTKGMFDGLRDVWPQEDLSDSFDAFEQIFKAEIDEIGKLINIFTPGRDVQDKNNQALGDAFKNLILGQLANVTVEQVFVSSNQVADRRNRILGLFEEQIDNASNNNDLLQRDALVDLRSAVLAHLDNETGNLPDEIEITPQVCVPVWVIANDLYGDADRGQEIIDSNEILNPNFVPGQTPIKVLTS